MRRELNSSAHKAHRQVSLRQFPLPQIARTPESDCASVSSTHDVSRCIGVELPLAGKRSKIDLVARMFAYVMHRLFVVIVPRFDAFNQRGQKLSNKRCILELIPARTHSDIEACEGSTEVDRMRVG